VTGRRIVVLAGPGDRRDEDLVAIAHAVAGRFDHYVCRRDDSLRDRASDEVPRLQAAALRATGVPAEAISIIPDEQEAIDAALRMGQPGDLLLIFADALVRSWKQITKFKPEGAAGAEPSAEVVAIADEGSLAAPAARTRMGASERRPGNGPADAASDAAGIAPIGEPALNLDGLIRDERGIRVAPETED